MKYVCDFCGLTSHDKEKVGRCETQGSSARYAVDQEVIFVCPILGARIELTGVIKEVVHKLRAHEVTYRIFVGADSRLRHQNCIYGGILDKNVLYHAQ